MKALALAMALLAAPAVAQGTAVATCDRQTTIPGFEAWGRGPASGGLAIGRPASLKLMPATTVAFAPPLARAPAAGTFGGAFPLHVATAGSYRVALSAGAWIDVIGQGRPVGSLAHTHGSACSGIAKIVTFLLAPGDYVVQLSEAKADGVLALVSASAG